MLRTWSVTTVRLVAGLQLSASKSSCKGWLKSLVEIICEALTMKISSPISHQRGHGFLDMLGSLECVHWHWGKRPVAWSGQSRWDKWCYTYARGGCITGSSDMSFTISLLSSQSCSLSSYICEFRCVYLFSNIANTSNIWCNKCFVQYIKCISQKWNATISKTLSLLV